ncbi:MAG: hypothetical protein ACR2QM_11365 [Longimicrobiales bacterium]
MIRRAPGAFTAGLLMVVAGCQSAPEGSAASAVLVGTCGLSTGPELTVDSSWDDRQGEYALNLIAPGEDGSQREVDGTLWLEANQPDDRPFARPGSPPDPTVTVPLYGWVDIDLGHVGGRRVGELESRDPMRPGALVLEQRRDPTQAPSVTIRLGSQANDRSRAAFESAYFAMRVAWLDDSGRFGGAWSSGLNGLEAKGTFCATPR